MSTTTPAQPAKVTAKVEEITPKKASEWLAQHNASNRNLNRHHVQQLANSIERGEWQLNGQTISFNEDGELQDGQHRLQAIARAGLTVRALVARGVPGESRKTIDVGRKRQVSDELTMQGYTHTTTLSSMLVMRKKVEGLRGSGWSTVLTAPEALKMLDEMPYAQHAAELARQITSRISIPPSVAGYTTMLFIEVTDDETAEEFWAPFETGDFSGGTDPRFVLQKTLHRLAATPHFSTSSFGSKVKQAGIVIKAWNAWRDGTNIKLIRFEPKTEKFPKVAE